MVFAETLGSPTAITSNEREPNSTGCGRDGHAPSCLPRAWWGNSLGAVRCGVELRLASLTLAWKFLLPLVATLQQAAGRPHKKPSLKRLVPKTPPLPQFCSLLFNYC